MPEELEKSIDLAMVGGRRLYFGDLMTPEDKSKFMVLSRVMEKANLTVIDKAVRDDLDVQGYGHEMAVRSSDSLEGMGYKLRINGASEPVGTQFTPEDEDRFVNTRNPRDVADKAIIIDVVQIVDGKEIGVGAVQVIASTRRPGEGQLLISKYDCKLSPPRAREVSADRNPGGYPLSPGGPVVGSRL